MITNEEIRIALIQMPVVDDKRKNLETAEAYVQRAAARGVQIAVLPEMFCCPYENQAFVMNAESEGGVVWSRLSAMAAKNRLILVGGSMPEKEGSYIYNTCYVFDQNGRQIGKHRKVHLFDIDIPGGQYFKESDTFAPGNRITVIETEYGKIGVEICFDIRFTEITHLMALAGAQMIFVPAAFNMTTGPAHWQLHFRARAVDSQVYMFGCAPARDMDASYHSYGHSIITSPWGDVVAELDEKPGILIQDVDLARVRAVREQLPIMNARRTDVYDLQETP